MTKIINKRKTRKINKTRRLINKRTKKLVGGTPEWLKKGILRPLTIINESYIKTEKMMISFFDDHIEKILTTSPSYQNRKDLPQNTKDKKKQKDQKIIFVFNFLTTLLKEDLMTQNGNLWKDKIIRDKLVELENYSDLDNIILNNLQDTINVYISRNKSTPALSPSPASTMTPNPLYKTNASRNQEPVYAQLNHDGVFIDNFMEKFRNGNDYPDQDFLKFCKLLENKVLNDYEIVNNNIPHSELEKKLTEFAYSNKYQLIQKYKFINKINTSDSFIQKLNYLKKPASYNQYDIGPFTESTVQGHIPPTYSSDESGERLYNSVLAETEPETQVVPGIEPPEVRRGDAKKAIKLALEATPAVEPVASISLEEANVQPAENPTTEEQYIQRIEKYIQNPNKSGERAATARQLWQMRDAAAKVASSAAGGGKLRKNKTIKNKKTNKYKSKKTKKNKSKSKKMKTKIRK